MRRTVLFVAFAVAFALAVASVLSFWPRCTSFGGIRGLAPAERTCTNQVAAGLLFALAAVVVGSAALRALHSRDG